MTGFETYDATGKLTFSTRDSTYLVVSTRLIPGGTFTVGNSVERTTVLPEGFTDAKVVMYPTTTLHPSTGAVMPDLHYSVTHNNRLEVFVAIDHSGGKTYPPCVLVILGN